MASQRFRAQEELDAIFTAWRLSGDIDRLQQPADADVIAAAEQTIGRALPDGLRALYRFSDGMEVLGGNLTVEPLQTEDGGMVGLADQLRGWDWPIPAELLMFGGNGSDDLFGLWYPVDADPHAPTPVVMVGRVFEPACLALAGTDLPAFLRAWSGYYLVLLEAGAAALDVLGLPEHLREIGEDVGLAPYFQWADPTLPDPNPDPYERGMDASAIAALLRR